MSAWSVPQERVPWRVRVNTYLAPHWVPAEWREWAVREIRSPGRAWKSLAVTSVPAVLLLPHLLPRWTLRVRRAPDSRRGGSRLGGRWLTRNFRRRQALAMLRGERAQDVRLRPWDIPLALGLGAVVVALLLRFGP